jgi:hypothetical protein
MIMGGEKRESGKPGKRESDSQPSGYSTVAGKEEAECGKVEILGW